MMSFSLIYLVQRFCYRIYDFLRHWYVDGFLWFVHQALNFLESLDHFFALKVTLRHLFKPLYQDYTFVGYVLGFFFRFWRLVFGGLVYLIAVLIAAAFYLVWALAPIYIVYRAVKKP